MLVYNHSLLITIRSHRNHGRMNKNKKNEERKSISDTIKFSKTKFYHELLYAGYSMIERWLNGTISWNFLRTFRCKRGQNGGKLDRLDIVTNESFIKLMLELCTLISEQFANLIEWKCMEKWNSSLDLLPLGG